jgi:ER degradation enhancer, mannosidase alpha-like 2
LPRINCTNNTDCFDLLFIEQCSTPSLCYNNILLTLAEDLGTRLLPAFKTATHIPFGTVNLRHGVPLKETPIASTAGAGSLSFEFATLSLLTNNASFAAAAMQAVGSIYNRRSKLDLVGKHINTETAAWQETASGLGSNADSFFEYLLKVHAMTGLPDLWEMFQTLYHSSKLYLVHQNAWFQEVDMFSGKKLRDRLENLDAFWPGIEAQLGQLDASQQQVC